MRRPVLAFLLALVVAGCTDEPDVSERPSAIVLPPELRDALVATVPSPTALAFLPDGRLLVTTQGGQVRVVAGGVLRATPALDLAARLCTNSERGLLGLAIDPDFASNRFVYLFYTFKKFGSCTGNVIGTSPVNRVARFTYDLATDTIAPASELVLVDNILSLNGNHNGGDLQIGADGRLYVAVGDSGCKIGGGSCGGGNPNGKFLSHLSGKILRVDRTTGAAPSDNPLVGRAGARRCGAPGTPPDYPNDDSKPCTELWAWGLRNPFRVAFQPGTSSFFINDVGQNVWEEIDEGARGANYGWNDREGFCANGQTCTPGAAPPGLTNPIHAYHHDTGCASITGGAFVPAGAWGAAYDGDYLFGDYVCGKLFRLERDGGAVTVRELASGMGGSSVVAMRFGPGPGAAPSLYYTTYAGGGQVRRLELVSGGNRAPTAALAASPVAGPVPLVVELDARGSSDPDPGDAITAYRWSFGDGATRETTTPAVSHTYTSAGTRTASVRVVDRLGAVSAPATVTITPGGSPPSVTLTSPAAGATFAAGQVLTLTATASDPEDGALPASALTWRVIKHHDTHTHPFFGPATGTNLTVTTEGPEDLLAASNSYLEVEVTATDTSGLTTTVRRDVLPRTVALSFQTSPPGLRLTLDTTFAITAPSTVTSWQGWGLRVRADDQSAGGVAYVFQGWSDGGAREHLITTPASPATYTATFSPGGFTAKVNFQPAGAPVPTGYLVDSGAAFGARGGGLSYGWNAVTSETRDRNASSSPDQRHDTLNHMQKPSNPDARWELAVPNGTYRVRIVAGDPGYTDSIFKIRAEGVLVVDGVPTTTTRWLDRSATVTVTDGRLTLSNAPGSANNKLCFVEVGPP